MTVYLSILVGPSPEQAEPVLATKDERAVIAALGAIMSRVQDGGSVESGRPTDGFPSLAVEPRTGPRDPPAAM